MGTTGRRVVGRCPRVRHDARVPAVRSLSVPYDSARLRVGSGAGPGALIEHHSLPDALRAAGFDVAIEEILIEEDLVPEVARSFAIVRRLAARGRRHAGRKGTAAATDR